LIRFDPDTIWSPVQSKVFVPSAAGVSA